MEKTGKQFRRVMASALVCLLLFFMMAYSAQAAESTDKGLVVEKLCFRDVLRQYALDPYAFGDDGAAVDGTGVTGSAKSLAAMFTYTVGLNYSGEGMNYNFFGKDITSLMGEEPYTDELLQATYDTEISPFHGYATANPKGQTVSIRVYRVGYTNAVNGVEPVFHYVWQQDGQWFAVKDDNPYYKVSWNGMNAAEAAAHGAYICRSESIGAGTEKPGQWSALAEAASTEAISLTDGTLVVGDGNANIFCVTNDLTGLKSAPGYSASITEISDYVRGGATYETGALLYSSDIYRADTMEQLDTGDVLEAGTKYQVRLVYDEGLVQGKNVTGITATCGTADLSQGVSDFVWYGSEEHLTANDYDPRTIEFTFVPGTGDGHFCRFTVNNLNGESSTLAPAPTFARMDSSAVVSYVPVAKAPSTGTPAAVKAEPAAETVAAAPVNNVPLTRGQAALMLWQRSGCPEIGQLTRFADLPADSTLATAISWAAQKGLIVGYGDNTFGPDNAFTREQSTLILSRFAVMQGHRAAVLGSLSAYPDGAAVSTWAMDSVIWAIKEGYFALIDGKICPQESAMQADFDAMLTKLENNK